MPFSPTPPSHPAPRRPVPPTRILHLTLALLLLAPACTPSFRMPTQAALRHAAALPTAPEPRIEGHLAGLERELEQLAIFNNEVVPADQARLLAAVPHVAPYLADARPRFRCTAARILLDLDRMQRPSYREDDERPVWSPTSDAVVLEHLTADLAWFASAAPAAAAGCTAEDVFLRAWLLARIPSARQHAGVTRAARGLWGDRDLKAAAEADPCGDAARLLDQAGTLLGIQRSPEAALPLPPRDALPPLR